jgi:hypothetical protein
MDADWTAFQNYTKLHIFPPTLRRLNSSFNLSGEYIVNEWKLQTFKLSSQLCTKCAEKN